MCLLPSTYFFVSLALFALVITCITLKCIILIKLIDGLITFFQKKKKAALLSQSQKNCHKLRGLTEYKNQAVD